ncbi:hypothetical protein ABQF26_03225 [Mycolicibacterium elephantis]
MPDPNTNDNAAMQQSREDWAAHKAAEELDAEAAILGDGGKAILEGYDAQLAELDERAATAERERDELRAKVEALEAQAAQNQPRINAGTPEPGTEGNDSGGTSEQAQGDPYPPGGENADDDRLRQANREAQKYRKELRAAEKARDEALELLARTRQQVLDDAIARAGIDPRLVAATGHSINDFLTDDGLLDLPRVNDTVTAVTAELNVSITRRPEPVPGLGSINPPAPPPTDSQRWSDAFRKTWAD